MSPLKLFHKWIERGDDRAQTNPVKILAGRQPGHQHYFVHSVSLPASKSSAISVASLSEPIELCPLLAMPHGPYKALCKFVPLGLGGKNKP